MSTEHAIGVPSWQPRAVSVIRELPGSARYRSLSGFWTDFRSTIVSS